MKHHALSDTQLRQTAAELLACAVMRTFPKSQIVRTEPSEGGFYCDFVFEEQVDAFALKALTEQMLILSAENPPARITEMMRENAKDLLKHRKQFYLADQAAAYLRNVIKLITWNDFSNIYSSKEPIISFSEVKYFKLLDASQKVTFVPGHGDVDVWRIHGVVFDSSKELKSIAKSFDQKKKTDHRSLGKEQELFLTADYSSTGSVIWLPRGKVIIDQLYDLWKQKTAEFNALEVISPPAINTAIQKKWNPYIELDSQPSYEFETATYTPILSTELFHAEIFVSRTVSYKELPFRTAEWKQISSFYHSHHLKGLLRSRTLIQDSLYSFCDEKQILKELNSYLQLIIESVKILGFETRWFLSAKEKKSAGTLENWNKCYELLRAAILPFDVHPDINVSIVDNEGPSLHLSVVDHLNREWRISSVGINLNLPHRIGLRYQGADNQVHLPWMITAQAFQSVERIVGLLLEKHQGWLPLWLAPEQVRIIPVSEKNKAYASELLQMLLDNKFRATVDQRNEKLGAKLRAVDRAKVPIVLIVGNQEEQGHDVALRRHGREETQLKLSTSELLEMLIEERDSKRCPQPFEE